tara:strand:- start:6401 stop:6835 length:435 start_codon:yes stop_codon:yes gene_type:complete
LEIEGNPKPQQRHRHFKYGTYDPCKKDKEDFLKKALKDYNYSKAFTHLPRLTPLHINIKFYMKRPKSHYRSGKYSGLVKDKWQEVLHTKKPDIDNLIKYVLDSLSGHNGFFLDDNQIYTIYAEKLYSDKPRTEIMIIEEDEVKN